MFLLTEDIFLKYDDSLRYFRTPLRSVFCLRMLNLWQIINFALRQQMRTGFISQSCSPLVYHANKITIWRICIGKSLKNYLKYSRICFCSFYVWKFYWQMIKILKKFQYLKRSLTSSFLQHQFSIQYHESYNIVPVHTYIRFRECAVWTCKYELLCKSLTKEPGPTGNRKSAIVFAEDSSMFFNCTMYYGIKKSFIM